MTQDGEKEFVLGNKQLISLFFVGVALCGVFFALGYMIGHKPAGVSLDATTTAPAGSSPQTQESEPPRETAASEPQAPTPTLAETQPPAGAVQTTSVTEPPSSDAPLTKTRAAQDTPAPTVPQPGATYLQVTALRRGDAESLVKTLKEQNFPTVIADSSKPDLFRVLVGPYHQTADVADAKARLKALGFANAFVQK